jgi:glucosylceramidase
MAVLVACVAAAVMAPAPVRAASTPVIRVDDSRPAQPFVGVGAAVTNSSAYLIEHGLAPATRDALLRTLFSPEGGGLSLLRVTIGGSDFNVGGVRYSEDDLPSGHADPRLAHFSLGHDTDTIAVLRAAMTLNPAIRVVASPWSAPAWMKTNGALDNLGLNGHLNPRFYAAYAAYLVRFLEGYASAGVPVWALTVANEPFGVAAAYEGMSMPATTEARFISGYLRPALRRAGLTTRVLALDESWDLTSYAQTVLGSRHRGADGVAWHCYDGNANTAMAKFARTLQIVSECAPNLINDLTGALLSDVFAAGAGGADLWNLALDPHGGPVVPPNQGCPRCTGLVTINPATGHFAPGPGLSTLEAYGHALRPGATRVAATALGRFDPHRHGRATPGLHDVAFADTDDRDVLFVTNDSPRWQRFELSWRGTSLDNSLGPHRTLTIEWTRSDPDALTHADELVSTG